MVAPYIKSTMYFKWKEYGWSESAYLKSTDLKNAVTLGGDLVSKRLAMLSKDNPDVEMVHARVSDPAAGRQAMVIPLSNGVGTMDGGAGSEVTNNPENSLMFRFQTENGLYSNIVVPFVPDTCIINKIFDDATVGKVFNAAMALYMTWLMENSWHVKKVPGQNPVLTQWDSYLYRRVVERKLGRPFGVSLARSIRP